MKCFDFPRFGWEVLRDPHFYLPVWVARKKVDTSREIY
jgi:hypothetical protein